MPYKRADSPIWWASFTNATGKRDRRSTGTTSRKEAAALEGKWKTEEFNAQKWGKEKSVTLDELLLYYLKEKSEKKSQKDDRLHAKRLRAQLPKKPIDELEGQDIASYSAERKGQGVSNATINRELALLSAAINLYNRDHNRALPNPTTGRKLKEAPGRIRWITQAEATRLIEAAKAEEKAAQHLPDFLTVLLNTGMRSGEALALEWNRVDLKNNLIYLHETDQKNGKKSSIPINQQTRAALLHRASIKASHCPSSQWVFCKEDGSQIKTVRRSFATACRTAKIEDFRVHDTRHTVAAWLVQSGTPITEVMQLLRHSDIRVTMRYAHLSPDNLRTTVDTLSRLSHAQ